MSEKTRDTGSAIQDERVMAAVAHATVIFSAVGLIGPLIIWGTQREKSRFVAFQALQAAAYQFLLLLGGLLAGALYMCSFLSLPVTALLSEPFDERGSFLLSLPRLLLHVWRSFSLDAGLAGLRGIWALCCRVGPPGERLPVRLPGAPAGAVPGAVVRRLWQRLGPGDRRVDLERPRHFLGCFISR